MGITDLFEELRPTVIRDTSLDQLKLSGKKVGIDATIWLVAVKETLIKTEFFSKLSKKQKDKKNAESFIDYCKEWFELLKSHNIKSMMVFDGNATPRKSGIKLLKKKIEGSSMSTKVAVNVDPDDPAGPDNGETDSDVDAKYNPDRDAMYIPERDAIIESLREEGVEFIIAPFEADAQLAYLAITGKIDAVITEDSDFIPFGCPHVLFSRVELLPPHKLP